ncbi:MAG TPA: hypothetical protein PLU59_03775 [Aliarcobacter cryaerophilus]|jgi:hypothetical protein|nr:hypothetical protein [Aliarcobacter sp.]HRG61047.1 hypothetical protein [Aliarcobacter cryaerophilus]
MGNLFSLFKREKIEKEIEKDCSCENDFIDPYSYCLVNPYFKSSENFSKIFSDFENRISSLQRYFETNQIHIENYLKFSKDELNQKKKEVKNQKELAAYGRCYFSDEEYFYEMHYLSVILMIFSLFETLLSDVSVDIAKSENKWVEDHMDKSLPYIKRYINFLEFECKVKLPISDDEQKKLDIIRKIRNNYLHSLEKDIPEEIQEELKRLMDIDDNKIKVNADFILMTFQIVGGIAQKLETCYWEYKKNKYKMK